MTVPILPAPAPLTAGLDIGVPLTRALEWFGTATNLPAWTGFFIEVGPAGSDGRHQAMSLAGQITTWIESPWTGSTDDVARCEVVICSVIRGRTERAGLTLERLDAARTRVTFTVTVLRPGSDATLRIQRARMAHELAAARRILEAAA
jgi:hypothetical protein